MDDGFLVGFIWSDFTKMPVLEPFKSSRISRTSVSIGVFDREFAVMFVVEFYCVFVENFVFCFLSPSPRRISRTCDLNLIIFAEFVCGNQSKRVG